MFLTKGVLFKAFSTNLKIGQQNKYFTTTFVNIDKIDLGVMPMMALEMTTIPNPEGMLTVKGQTWV